MRMLALAGAVAALTLGDPARAQEAVPEPEPCTINFRSSDFVLSAIDQFGYGFEGYGELCADLRARGMGVSVLGGVGEVNEAKIGLALVRVHDLRTGAVSVRYSTSTGATLESGADVDGELMVGTLTASLESLAVRRDEFTSSLISELARLRALPPVLTPVQPAAVPEAECQFDISITESYLQSIIGWGDLDVEGLDAVCSRFAVEGVSLSLIQNTVVDQYGVRSVVFAGVMDRASGIEGPNYQIGVSTRAGTDEAVQADALRSATINALADLVTMHDMLITSMQAEVVETRAAVAASGG